MLHADIAILVPVNDRSSASGRCALGAAAGSACCMNDGQQLGLQVLVNHWNMGRRLLDRVRPMDVQKRSRRTPDPAADETRTAMVSGRLRIHDAEPASSNRRTSRVRSSCFPTDPDILFFAASAHETFAGVRTQSAMRSIKSPRDVTFDVQDEGAELRRAEQLYKRALERNPRLVEARIRLGRVLGLRGRHRRRSSSCGRAGRRRSRCCSIYAHLFLGGGVRSAR